jgi:hypothetical protein
MKVGTLTFEQAVKKLYATHSVMADQLGEFVSMDIIDYNLLEVYTSAGDDLYSFTKSKNETVEVCVATNSNSSFQYMRMYTDDGNEMDFVLFEPAPIITMQELLHPVS